MVVDAAAYLLLDELGERLCAAWPFVPVEIAYDSSLSDMADYASRFAGCTADAAAARLEFLLHAGILGVRDGRPFVDEQVAEMLRRKGRARIGETADDKPPPLLPTRTLRDDDDADDEEFYEE